MLKTLAQREGSTQLTLLLLQSLRRKKLLLLHCPKFPSTQRPSFQFLTFSLCLSPMSPLDPGLALFCSWIKGVCWGWALVFSKQKAPGSKAEAIPQLETTGHSLGVHSMIKYPVTASLSNRVQFSSGALSAGWDGAQTENRKPSLW